MIFGDTETTGLLIPNAASIAYQPYLIEVYYAKTDDDCNIIDEFETFVKPPVPIPEHITKITGINDAMVAKAPSFALLYDDLVDFYLGERRFVAHNCRFDTGVLYCELLRMGMETKFPWPPEQICTVEKSMPLEDKRLSLKKLYKRITGKDEYGAHRAKNDVKAMITCYRWLVENGLID